MRCLLLLCVLAVAMVNAYDKAEPGVFCGDCEVKYYETCAFNVHDPVIVRYFENSCKWEKFQAENGEDWYETPLDTCYRQLTPVEWREQGDGIEC